MMYVQGIGQKNIEQSRNSVLAFITEKYIFLSFFYKKALPLALRKHFGKV